MSEAEGARARIAVVGLGNVLLGDDGFGPFVVELLRAGWDFPAGVELIDAGTPGLGLVTHLDDREVLLLVDAVGATGRPGERRRYSGDDLRTLPPKPRVSPHDPAVQEAIWITDLAGRGPRRVVLFGVIPASLNVGLQLSPPVRDAAAATAALVVHELAACGAPPVPRVNPPTPDAWWLRLAAG